MKEQRIKASDIAANMVPVDQLFLEAVKAYMESGGEGYEVRTVPVTQVRVPKGYEATTEGLAIMYHNFADVQQKLQSGPPVMVLERGDGSLWSYDDVHAVTACHDLAPGIKIRVVIIGHDPTPPAVA